MDDVGIDEALVRSLLHEQHPDLRGGIQEREGEGDSVAAEPFHPGGADQGGALGQGSAAREQRGGMAV